MKFLVLSILFVFIAQDGWAQSLTVQFHQIRNNEGELSVSLYNDERTWLVEDNCYREIVIPKYNAQNSSIRVIIDSIPPGVYAIALLDDEDNNGKMRHNFIGLPKEGFGFSNNVKPFLKRPKFKECAFEFKNDTIIYIALQYR